MMKRMLFLVALLCIASSGAARGADIINAVNLDVVMVNQDPYVAEPNSYVTILFKLENSGIEAARNVTFEFLPKYPFSLDPGESAVRSLGTAGGVQTTENFFLMKYKVRVDKDALDGENEINARYTYSGAAGYNVKTFNVTISDPKTDFDVVLQDSSESSITLALANIGVNPAYSVTVRVPEQGDFTVTGISSSILGNLNSADYTLVTFDMVPNYQIGSQGSSEERTLRVEVFYTDTIGVRRVVQKEVPVSGYSGYTGLANATIPGFSQRTFTRGNTTQGLTYIAAGIAGVAAAGGFFLYRKRKKGKN